MEYVYLSIGIYFVMIHILLFMVIIKRNEMENLVARSVFHIVYDLLDKIEKEIKKELNEKKMELKNDIILNAFRVIDKLKEDQKKNNK